VGIQRAARKSLQQESLRFAESLEKLKTLVAGAGGERQAIVAGLGEHESPLPALIAEALAKVDDARFDEAKKLVYEQVRPRQAVVDLDLEKLVDVVTHGGQEAARQADRRHGVALTTLAALAALALLIGASIAYAITRTVARPLRDAVGVAERVAAGDLSTAIAWRTQDETGRLLAALANMQSSLRAMVGEIHSASEAIGKASGELSRGSLDLSQRTEEQAAALEQTASSMEELTGSVQRNSESAVSADRFTTDSALAARDGGEAMRRVVATMGDLDGSARRITEIVAVIDSIAFQTNILALNAAVEAARAGEQGRGFAVVAAEVRSLAQRSAAAAKDVAALAQESSERVRHGNAQVESAGEKIAQVVAAFEKVTAIVAEISSASREQARGISQVNQTVTQLDGVTQQNAQLVQRSVSAAGALGREAERLTSAVKAFVLDARPLEIEYVNPLNEKARLE
jgi:methyl-accepting chemotaxis protein